MKTILACIAVAFLIVLPGCSILGDTFRDKKEEQILEIERYDATTGRPMKTARIIDDRPIAVEYKGPDGKPIRKKEKHGGWFISPPPLPLPEPKAEVVPAEH